MSDDKKKPNIYKGKDLSVEIDETTTISLQALHKRMNDDGVEVVASEEEDDERR